MNELTKVRCLQCRKASSMLIESETDIDHPEDFFITCPNCSNWESGQIPFQGFELIEEVPSIDEIAYTTMVERKDIVEFKLVDGDTVLMTTPHYESLTTSELNGIDASLIYNGLEHQYTVVLSEPEYNDEHSEIIGFQKLI